MTGSYESACQAAAASVSIRAEEACQGVPLLAEGISSRIRFEANAANGESSNVGYSSIRQAGAGNGNNSGSSLLAVGALAGLVVLIM